MSYCVDVFPTLIKAEAICIEFWSYYQKFQNLGKNGVPRKLLLISASGVVPAAAAFPPVHVYVPLDVKFTGIARSVMLALEVPSPGLFFSTLFTTCTILFYFIFFIFESIFNILCFIF